MYRRTFFAMTAASALSLSACGGSSGGGSNFRPSPTPTPTPPPEEPAITDLVPLPPEGSAHEMVGYEVTLTGGLTDFESGDVEVASTGFAISYDPSLLSYVLTLPGFETAAISPGSVGERYNSFLLDDPANPGGVQNLTIYSRVLDATQSWCSCSNIGTYFSGDYTTVGAFAVGTRAASEMVLAHGSAVFSLSLEGVTDDPNYIVRGSGELNFDVTESVLTGVFEPLLVETFMGGAAPIGIYTVSNGVFAVGNPDFSGLLVQDGTDYGGDFAGFFTSEGFQAIGTWTVTFDNQTSGRDSVIYGVFLGTDISGP